MSPGRPASAASRMTDFHRLPGTTPQRDTNLQADEIVTAVELPARGFAKNYTYLKIRDRLSYAFALVSVAAALELDGDTIKEARLALGGVAHKPWRDPTPKRRCAARPPTAPPSCRPRTLFCATPKATPTTPSRSIWRAASSCAPDASGARHAAIAVQQEDPVTAMSSTTAAYIGTPTSRVDGHAKVTGAREICRRIQHPGPRLRRRRRLDDRQGPHRAHRRKRGAARRRRARYLDPRAPAAHGRQSRKPTGTTSGRKKARRSVRSTTTGSCSAVSRSRWSWPRNGKSPASPPRWCASNTRSEKSVTDLQAERDKAFTVKKPEKPRGKADKAYAAAAVRHEAEYFIPSEYPQSDGIVRLDRDLGGRRQAHGHDKTQGVQNVQRYLCSVFGMKPDDVRVMSAFMGGGFGSGLRPQYQVGARGAGGARARTLGAAGADPAADVWARLSPGHDRASCARRETRRNARRGHPRGDRGHVAIRRFLPQRHRLVGPALQKPERQICAPAGAARSADAIRHARAGRGDRRLWAGMRDGRACGRAQARSARAAAALLFGSRSERGQTLYQQEAARMLPARRGKPSAGTSAIRSRARCATAASWSAGAWRPASGKRCRWRRPSASC